MTSRRKFTESELLEIERLRIDERYTANEIVSVFGCGVGPISRVLLALGISNTLPQRSTPEAVWMQYQTAVRPPPGHTLESFRLLAKRVCLLTLEGRTADEIRDKFVIPKTWISKVRADMKMQGIHISEKVKAEILEKKKAKSAAHGVKRGKVRLRPVSDPVCQFRASLQRRIGAMPRWV